ncbi:MAG: SMC-Scp complex subunit ScpB [Chitinophagaceae bacterium]
MDISTIIPHVEALIFASDKPLSSLETMELINSAMGFIDDVTTEEQIQSAIDGIQEKYATDFYSFELVQSGGGWQFLTKSLYHKTVAQLNGDKFIKKLSTAALETLAIIAYKQPVTKSEMEAIRGVNCDYAVQKLLEKDLIIISGRNEDAVGKPLIYGTSKSFMDYFGINSADDLPKINELLLDKLTEATNVQTLRKQQELGDHPEVEPEQTAEVMPTLFSEMESNVAENIEIISDSTTDEAEVNIDEEEESLPDNS